MTPQQLGQTALRRRWQAWKQVDGLPDEVDEGAILATEMAMWVTGLRELAEDDGTVFDGDDARLLDGLKWARNRGVHGLIHLAEMSEGAVFPMVFPKRYRHYTWSEAADDPRARPSQEKIKPDYVSHVAGRPVRRTIYDAAALLDVTL